MSRQTYDPFTRDMLAAAFVLVVHHHFLRVLEYGRDRVEFNACLNVMHLLGVQRETVWKTIWELAYYAAYDGYDYTASLNELWQAVCI